MLRFLLVTFLLVVASFASATSWEDLQHQELEKLNERIGESVGPFGEKGMYELTNIMSIQSTFGATYQNDLQETTNTGSITLDTGYIDVKTGTTTNSTARLETQDRGQYQPGKAAEFGIGLFIATAPDSGTEKAQWGVGDSNNGIFWRYVDNNSDGDFELCIVYERADSEDVVCNGGEGTSGFNMDGLGPFDPLESAAIWTIRFNWYGVGGADYWIYYPNKSGKGGLKGRLVHRFIPDKGQALEDPNLPIFAEVDNGDGTTDVEIEVGGRRYDIQGKFNPERRTTGDSRAGQTLTASGSPIEPIICVQREDPFPEAGRQNSVYAFVDRFAAVVDDTVEVWFVSVTGTLDNASFRDPARTLTFQDEETALEYDISATGISGAGVTYHPVAGPFAFTATNQSLPEPIDATKGQRIEIIGSDPLCMVAIVTGGTDVTLELGTLQMREEF